MFKNFLAGLMVLLFAASVGATTVGVWNSAFEGTDGIAAPMTNAIQGSVIDDHARAAVQAIRLRVDVEHFIGDQDGLSDDNGLHRLGSGRCYFQDAAPTSMTNSHSSASNILDLSNTGGAGVGDLNDAASQSAAEIQDDVGTARCWIDTDDNNRLYYYIGIAADNTPSTIADGWVPASSLGTNNAVTHGGFDAADGDGDTASTVIPWGWTLVGTTTYTYDATPDVTEGDGLMLVTTAGANDSGISQTLGGLHSARWYRFSVRVKAASGDECQLAITGDSRTVPSASEVVTTSTSMVTLSIIALTDGTPADLVMILRGQTNTDVCTWDHASAERLSGPADPGVIIYEATSTDNGTACGAEYTSDCVDIVELFVTPPGPGYQIVVEGRVALNVSATTQCLVNIEADTTDVEEVSFFTGSTANRQTLYVSYRPQALVVPGTAVNYSLNAKESSGTCATAGSDSTHRIRATLTPSGR